MEAESSSVVHELSQSLPNELIIEILIRLPVKSLARFKCVSKPWLSQISNPTFTKSHLNFTINNKNSRYLHDHRLLCISWYPSNHFREFSLHYLLHGTGVDDLPSLEYNIAYPELPMRIVGSCNGVVCVVVDEEHFFLWNPTINRYKHLPRLQMRCGLCCYLKDGFGYDAANDDYKVVGVFYCMIDSSPYEVQIFSLKTNKWKRIEDFKYGAPLDQSAKYARGKLHWLVNHGEGAEIVSLDLASERYGKMGIPKGLWSSWAYDDDVCPTLGLFSEDLCLLFDDHKSRIDVWVMKEYGNRDSWGRVFTFPCLGSPGFYPHMLRLWLVSDDEILFLYGCVNVVYNRKENVYRFPDPVNEDVEIYQGVVFVQSLVSPSGQEDEEEDEDEDEEEEGGEE